jgi:hypothetical protein
MIRGKPEIFVHMKNGDVRPLDRMRNERGEKFRLRRGAGKNHPHLILRGALSRDDFRDVRRGV